MGEASVRTVRGVGPKKAEQLESIGVSTLTDALLTYPRDYEDRTQILPIDRLVQGDRACICAVVGVAPVLKHVRSGMAVTKLRVFDESGTLDIVYFNNKYIAAQLRHGETYLFYGRVQRDGPRMSMLSPVHEHQANGEAPRGRIVPIYPLTAGLSQSDMIRVTDAALTSSISAVPDCLPDTVRQRYGFAPIATCLTQIHRPQSLRDLAASRERMIFEELFLLCCGLFLLKARRKTQTTVLFSLCNLDAFWRVLGFTPTAAQVRTIAEITQDTVSPIPMNRLVQGDVGSGKTAVAAALCVLAVQNGYQAAIMAPTELLCTQHFHTLQPIMSKLGITCALLTGSLRPAEKRAVKEKIVCGTAQIVIGTHALIQQDVAFARLGAVIVDEQHRFGVNQRALLSAKGESPHVLVMSATPIPRTLALILYGDLDVSVLDELPPGRTPVETFAVGEKMRQRIERFIEKQCADHGQVYVVCPLVEEGEQGLRSALQHVENLREALPQRRIGLLYGRMKSAEKDAVMAAFVACELDILVATTVIEVGVNVPNATLMVVEDADRFGLSQLHQLRGRVGRGNRASYCVLFGADKGEIARARLRLLASTGDGFLIAHEDLAQRGPGDFFGSRQHGLPTLHIANLASDLETMQNAQTEAQALLQADPALEHHPILLARVSRLFSTVAEGAAFS